MSQTTRNLLLFLVVGALIALTGLTQSWNAALTIVNMGLISAIMALGVNIQWGYAGLYNVGTMGFVALGGLATVLVALDPVPGAWQAGGFRILAALLFGAAIIAAAALLHRRLPRGRARILALAVLLISGLVVYRWILDPAVAAVEAINPALQGNIGGLGLPVLLSWPVGGLLAAGAGWLIGKTALGLRSDYLAIATLGIAEIVIAVMKNEDWLDRGVKNIVDIPRPVPFEVDLQASQSFLSLTSWIGADSVAASAVAIKLIYAGMFLAVLLVLVLLSEAALHSPWGRMMRAIRDNEVAAAAMGKDVTRRHLQIFVLGCAVLGIAGAMLATMEGQLTPGAFQPLRFTFLIWVMVVVGGSGSNLGAVLGGFLIWYLWVQVEPWGNSLMAFATAGMADGSALKRHLMESAAHMRLLVMGVILIVVLRFRPQGLIPGK
ncbi:MAG: branched-chain amino acid ABC transporter permease [Chelatococcus sp.]|uniref:branched-chain amino acid ABC transporter permease n=1 Tax=Chelatococcus sp. TaxID=1953771 RepID=UPI0025BF628A|nr:branched-chain amino acid ABC transporter permease [Chelatococcus sp.]MBX3537426.1 branched-chain amino acid ABC transporter permease [Chelatococcus sp.]